jgi:hypothetical protein
MTEAKNIVRTQIGIDALQGGMTVEWYGEMITVENSDIKRGGFCGTSFRGDASKRVITRIQFAVPTSVGIRLE